MYDQGFAGQWGAGAGDAPAPPKAPTEPQPQVNQPQTQLPSAEAQHIHALLEAVVAFGAGQQAFMGNQTRYGLALEALTRHLDNTTLGSSQSNSQPHSRGVKTRDPRMFNGCSTEVVSFLREIRAYYRPAAGLDKPPKGDAVVDVPEGWLADCVVQRD
ncbi:hypothetical protein IEO21_08294 [Rhodonia placenta]|uniref:Uncharacterized protein n=1 Tax=Rhodonia placenta TaxID=104341 RepID=A0A8H7TZH9_9APHY|nr:hypothetical protein IEO21_08294 [Postia placenta]